MRNKYYFGVNDDRELANWQCFAYTEKEAVEAYIKVLEDQSICADEYDRIFYKAVIEKLTAEQYEVTQADSLFETVNVTYITTDEYITIEFTDEEIDRMM